jgi:hypothetical protein
MTHRSTMCGAVAAFCLVFGMITARADLMKDSPVTFPEKGALPSKYPPDVQTERYPAESDYSLFASPCRSLKQIDTIQAEMIKGEFTPPPTDWTHLLRTRRMLTEGGGLHVLGLGDSIVNDTMRSGWLAKLQQAYPKAEIRGTVYVRGGGGCQHYREEDRIVKYVVPLEPDLVFIGGISQRSVEEIREVIHQLRAGLPEVEILLANGTFGSADPRDSDALDEIQNPAGYTRLLKKLAAEERCAFVDMRTPWIQYLLSAKVHPHLFYRDRVHANEFGEQILTKILLSFFRAEDAGSATGNTTWPAPADVPEAVAGVDSPGGAGLPDIAGAASPDAPAIAAISDVTFPDETLVITGERLDGATLQVWAEGGTFDIRPLRSAANRMQAVVPRDASCSTMLVWLVKDGQAGAPIRVNGATAWWAWPPRVEAGSRPATVRVFGKNLRLPTVADPRLVLVDDSGVPRTLKLKTSNPYSLQADLPDDLKPGIYCVRAHNGTGGVYGWSEAVTFEVVEPLKIPDAVFAVDDYLDAAGDSDRGAILLAIEAAVKQGGGIVHFAARHYRDVVGATAQRDTIGLPEGVPIVLRGAGMGGYDWHHDPTTITGTGTLVSSAATHVRHPVFELQGRGQRVEDMTILVQGTAQASGPDMEQRISGINLKGADQRVQRVRLVRSEHCGHWLLMSLTRGTANNEIVDCEFYHAATGIRVMPGSHFTRIANCRMRGHYSQGRSTDANSVQCDGNHLILENCDFAGLNKTGGKILGRTFLSGNGYMSLAYLAGNRSENVGSHSSVPGIDGNTSEQYLFHVGDRDGGLFRVVQGDPGGVVLEEKAASMLDQSVVTRPWTTTMDRAGKRRDGDWAMFVAGGRGVGQWRLLSPESAGENLRVTKPWRVIPDATSTVIVQRVFRNNIIYDNVINPSPDPAEAEDHKTVGVFWWINCFENITAGNTMKNLGVGVGLSIFSGAERGDTANVWNLTRDNIFENMIGGVGDAAPVPVFYSDHHIGDGWAGLQEDFDHWRTVGNIFRGNHGEGTTALAHHGWMRFDEIGAGYRRRGTFEQHGHRIKYQAGPEKGMVMSVLENNVLLGGRRGILLSAPANWTLLRNNRLEVLDADNVLVEYYGRDQVQQPAVSTRVE